MNLSYSIILWCTDCLNQYTNNSESNYDKQSKNSTHLTLLNDEPIPNILTNIRPNKILNQTINNIEEIIKNPRNQINIITDYIESDSPQLIHFRKVDYNNLSNNHFVIDILQINEISPVNTRDKDFEFIEKNE